MTFLYSMVNTKRCPRCERVLSLTEFHRNRSSKNGVTGWCKDCANEKNREYYRTPLGIYNRFKTRVNYYKKKPFNLDKKYFLGWYDKQEKVCIYCGIPEDRLELMQEGFRIAIEDVAWVPLYIPKCVYGIADYIAWNPRSDMMIAVEYISFK